MVAPWMARRTVEHLGRNRLAVPAALLMLLLRTKRLVPRSGMRLRPATQHISYQGETWMLDSPEDICAGQAWFEYPATFVLFSKLEPLVTLGV
jgi:hypothetical protein